MSYFLAECLTRELRNLPEGIENIKTISSSSARDCKVIFGANICISSRLADAQALISAHAGKPCVFPFKHAGVTYTKCKVIFGDIPICSTRVDPDGNHVDGHWGICDSNCPTEGRFYDVLNIKLVFWH